MNLPPASDEEPVGKDASNQDCEEARGAAGPAAGRNDGLSAASGESSLVNVGRNELYVEVGIVLALFGAQ